MKYAIYAFIVSAVVTIALGPVIIPMLRRLKFGQNERSDGPQSHLSKAGHANDGRHDVHCGHTGWHACIFAQRY